jgi:hypothetical protein
VIVFGNGDGTFSEPQRLYGGQNPTQIVIGDINSDGYLDIVTANNAIDAPLSSLLGDGAGGFTVAPTVVSGGDPWPRAMIGVHAIAAADFNRDGNLDLVGRDFGLEHICHWWEMARELLPRSACILRLRTPRALLDGSMWLMSMPTETSMSWSPARIFR